MHTILIMTSHVAFGQVGLAATAASFWTAGAEVVALPTVVLSNHPGHARSAGTTLDPAVLEDMTAALDANGWLGNFGTLFTGYLPTAAHAACAGRVADQMRRLNANLLYVCDPILGDDPGGLYVDPEAAAAVRDTLVPRADVLVPNRFELSWLSGIDVRSISDAVVAGRTLPCPKICVTSIPDGSSRLANVLVTPNDILVSRVERRLRAPHGTGDLFAGSLTSELMRGAGDAVALGIATGTIESALNVSGDSDRLLLPRIDWTNGVAAVRVERFA